MRIAVISDTHDAVPRTLLTRIECADEIWHLGDVTTPEVLAEVECLGPPLRVVMGNCDFCPRWPLNLTLEREGLVFHLVHIPPQLAPPKVNAVLHGHTHMPRDWTDPLGVRWLNPGSITHPRGGHSPSFAWLELDAQGLRGWQLQRISR